MSAQHDDELGMQLDKYLTIKLDWQTTASLAAQAHTLKLSFDDMIEHAMKAALQGARPHFSTHRWPLCHAPTHPPAHH